MTRWLTKPSCGQGTTYIFGVSRVAARSREHNKEAKGKGNGPKQEAPVVTRGACKSPRKRQPVFFSFLTMPSTSFLRYFHSPLASIFFFFALASPPLWHFIRAASCDWLYFDGFAAAAAKEGRASLSKKGNGSKFRESEFIDYCIRG
jgi:hypothetical protein